MDGGGGGIGGIPESGGIPGLNIGGGGLGGGGGTIAGPSPENFVNGTGGGITFPIIGFSFLNANCKKNCFVSLFQCVQNLPSAFSTSLLGTCQRDT